MKAKTARTVVNAIFSATLLFASTVSIGAERIRVFTGSSPVFSPIFVADRQGFFKEEGLDVQVRVFTSGAEATEGFRAGAADFLVAADVPLLYLLAGGDTVMLMQFSAAATQLLIVGPKGRTSPADLKSKKIGLVTKSASEYLLSEYLKHASLSLNDVERVSLSPFDQVSALLRGDVYALSIWKPFDSKINQLGGDKFETATWNAREKFDSYAGIVAKREFVKRDPGDVQKVVRALQKATRWLSANSVNANAVPLAGYLKTTPRDVESVMANVRWDIAVTPEFLTTMSNIEGFLDKQGLIQKRVDFGAAYDWSFVKQLDSSLVK